MKLSFRAGTIAAAVLVLTFSASLSAAPRLLLSASTVGPIYVAPGSNGVVQTVQASNAGTGVLNPSAITSASWLAASIGTQFSCSAPSGICWPVNVALNTSALAPGNYTEYVTVQDPNAVDSPQQISVNVVIANVPNSITLYAPPNGGAASSAFYPHSRILIANLSTNSGGNWLSVAPPVPQLTFGVPYVITAAAQVGQAPGTYTGSFLISGSTLLADIGLGYTPYPAQPGNVIIIYCTGLGQTTPVAQSGQAASLNPTLTVVPVTVSFSSLGTQVTATSTFAGLTPTLVGLYQVNVTIPANAPIGMSIPLSISSATGTSNIVNIPISLN